MEEILTYLLNSFIGKKNEHGLFVASQDRILRASLQEIPGNYFCCQICMVCLVKHVLQIFD